MATNEARSGTEALPAVASRAVDAAVDHVVRVTRQEEKVVEKRPFLNNIIRILNSGQFDDIQPQLLDSERLYLERLRNERREVYERVRKATKHWEELRCRMEEEIATLQEQENRDLQEARQREIAKREALRVSIAEAARTKREYRLHQRDELAEKRRQSRAEILRWSRRTNMADVESFSLPTKGTSLESDTEDDSRRKARRPNPVPTETHRRVLRQAEEQKRERIELTETAAKKLAKRYEYGDRVRLMHAPVVSPALQSELAERIERIYHPPHVRQPVDVRSLYPVPVTGRTGRLPATDGSGADDDAPAKATVPDYLTEMQKKRLHAAKPTNETETRADVLARIQSLDDSIRQKETALRRPDATAVALADDLSRLSVLYLTTISSKIQLCDMESMLCNPNRLPPNVSISQ